LNSRLWPDPFDADQCADYYVPLCLFVVKCFSKCDFVGWIERTIRLQALVPVYCEDEPEDERQQTCSPVTRRAGHRQAAGIAEAGVVNRTGRIAYAFSKSSAIRESPRAPLIGA
jgi:hypothetical protein